MTYITSSRQLQTHDHKESDIQDFFKKYGPSARDCYAYCSNLDSYLNTTILPKLNKMSWDTIISALTSKGAVISLEEGSHRLILIEPQPNNVELPQIRIITKAMGQLLWNQDSVERGKNHRRLYTMLHRESSAKRFTGTLFEPPFHDLCVRGTTLKLYPMTETTKGPANYTFVNYSTSEDVSEELVLPPQEEVTFNHNDPLTRLLPNRYYMPTAGNQPSYDSFIYESNFRRLTLTQITEGESHGLKPKGIYGLRDLARKLLGISDLKLRVVIVVPENHQVMCPVDKAMYDKLGLEMYYVEVTESALYDTYGNVDVSQTIM